MTKYEYYHSVITDFKCHTEYLNEMGAKGWELVSVVEIDTQLMMYWKREISK